MNSLNKEYTISDYTKAYKEESVTFASLHLKEVDIKINGEKIILLSDSILDKYTDVLNEYLVTKTLTDSEYNKYQYNPKLLSYALYGTVELWFLILYANQLCSVTQFHINPVKVYSSGVIKVIQSILNLEKPVIDANEEEVKKALNSL